MHPSLAAVFPRQTLVRSHLGEVGAALALEHHQKVLTFTESEVITMSTTYSTETRMGHLVGTVPGAWHVLLKHRLDFCCGGGKTLQEACEKRGLDPSAVIHELEAQEALTRDPHGLVGWDERPLPELIDHILDHYHVPLKESLPHLKEMARKVLRVHGSSDPERLKALHQTVLELSSELLVHMAKEENILFPWIRSGNGRHARSPIHVMLHEHDVAGEMLEEISELTQGFTPPEGACRTWQTLYKALEELDGSLRRHIHLENNVLFPRALAS